MRFSGAVRCQTLSAGAHGSTGSTRRPPFPFEHVGPPAAAFARTTGFFASHHEHDTMSRLREALGNLPDSAFVDVLESDESYCVVVDVPGVTADDLDVRIDGRSLVVEAHRAKDVPAGFEYRTEERSLFLDLELPLPPDAAAADAAATVDAGVLEVTLPKRGERGHSVPISG